MLAYSRAASAGRIANGRPGRAHTPRATQRPGFGQAHPLCIWGDTYLSNERGDEGAHPSHAAAGAQAQRSGRRGVDLKHSRPSGCREKMQVPPSSLAQEGWNSPCGGPELGSVLRGRGGGSHPKGARKLDQEGRRPGWQWEPRNGVLSAPRAVRAQALGHV